MAVQQNSDHIQTTHIGSLPRPHDLLDLPIKLVPDSSLDGVRVTHGEHFHPPGLAVSVEPADPLVQTHRVPGKVNMNETVAVFL